MLKKVISSTEQRCDCTALDFRRGINRVEPYAQHTAKVTSPKGGRGTSHCTTIEPQPTVPNASSSTTAPSRIRVENTTRPAPRASVRSPRRSADDPRPLLSTATRHDRSIACKQTQDPVALATATARRAAERALRVAARPLALLACELRAGARGRPVGVAPETCARGAATGTGDSALSAERASDPATSPFFPRRVAFSAVRSQRKDEERRSSSSSSMV